MVAGENAFPTQHMYAIFSGNGHSTPLTRAMTDPRQRPRKTADCMLVNVYCHNIPSCTPQSGYYGVTNVANTPM